MASHIRCLRDGCNGGMGMIYIAYKTIEEIRKRGVDEIGIFYTNAQDIVFYEVVRDVFSKGDIPVDTEQLVKLMIPNREKGNSIDSSISSSD